MQPWTQLNGRYPTADRLELVLLDLATSPGRYLSNRLVGIIRHIQRGVDDVATRSTYPPNVVRNQKYSIATFLPLVFYEQFKFFFNFYFLVVALSQFIPALKIGESLAHSVADMKATL